ncbi:GntR family transcriptional regulator [Rhizobium multihospitium]|uniref:DNA-binding transcriptional regulator, GntR family n=1 Tax=Rhizobium multihospitium TaxID=410764 RepID=A0A1C3UK42_9HYPH|nr:GntR family transcriptional regulator [Rhizobium multihospitium]SCB15870.1 DNA-binding transcriptional regulator, GntR family [Rhizobium multihospitium]
MLDHQSPFLAQSPSDLVAIAEDRIRNAIKLGEFSPGERLSEQVLCDTYRFGRGVVRSALSRLAHKGFVSAQPRSGWRVCSITALGLREITLGRTRLEPLLVDVDLSADDIARLETLCDMQAALRLGGSAHGSQLSLIREYERQIRSLLAARLKAPLIADWLDILWHRADYYLNFFEASSVQRLEAVDWTDFVAAKKAHRNGDAAELLKLACDAFAEFTQASLLKSELAAPVERKAKRPSVSSPSISNDETRISRPVRERSFLKKDF